MIDFETCETNDDGDTIVTFTLDSNLLPAINVDTYQSFNGDSWLEYETEYYRTECGMPDDADLDVTYDWDGIIRALGEANIDWLTGEFPEIFQSIEIISTYSPSAYNFETDSFRGVYTVNWTAFLRAYREAGAKSAHDWMIERWSSRDGFMSFIPSRWYSDDDTHIAVKRWLAFHWWMSQAIEDDESLFLHVAEAEHEAYGNNTTVTLPERDDS